MKKGKPYILFIRLVPKASIFLFLIFYIMAIISYYDSIIDIIPAKTFSIWNIYLCDLIESKNTFLIKNPSRPYAMAALWSISFGLLFLWRRLASKLKEGQKWKQWTWYTCGSISILYLLLLPYGNHDFIILVSGIFGAISTLFLTLSLKKNGYFKQTIYGIIFLSILLFNYVLYISGSLMTLLPTIQKVTFSAFIAWFLILNSTSKKQLQV